MTLSPLEQHAQEIIQKTGFIIESTLQFGTAYDGNPRSLVYGGLYEQKPAVLKVYNESHGAPQPEDLLLFAQHHASAHMKVPQLYAYEVESFNAGWMIMEYVPAQTRMFRSPVTAPERALFIRTFLEYRSHFSLAPIKPLGKLDRLYVENGKVISAVDFHLRRIAKWQKMAQVADAEYIAQGAGALLTEALQQELEKAAAFIGDTFANQPLYWCHGHFKPNEIHIDSVTGDFWITDFGHMALFPRGYEFAFMIWADVLMEFGGEHVNITAIATHEDPSQQRIQAQAAHGVISYAAHRQRVRDWILAYNTEVARFIDEPAQASVTADVRQALVLEKDLQMAALLERILGSLYADTIARVEIPYEQKQERVALLQQLVHEILNDTLLEL